MFQYIQEQSRVSLAIQRLETAPADQIVRSIESIKSIDIDPRVLEERIEQLGRSGMLRFSTALLALGELDEFTVDSLCKSLDSAQPEEFVPYFPSWVR